MRSQNQVKSSDLEPREIVSNDSLEVLRKRDHGDIITRLASFDPTSIVGYAKEIGQSPKEGVDELEFEIAKAQMLAFSCWRGHSELPEFSVLNGNLRCDTPSVVLEGIECSSELSDDAPPGFECYRAMHDLIRSLNNSQLSNVRVDEHVAFRAACLCSTRLVEYLKGLGGSPCGEVDVSELAAAKAQLLAFSNWKGYSQLPELTLLDGYLASNTCLGVSGCENCAALIASTPVGFGGNESTLAAKRDLDGQTEQRRRPYRAVGYDLISPAACLEPTKLVSDSEVSGVSPCGGYKASKLIHKEPKAQSSHLPEFNRLSGQISGEENLSNKLIEDSIPHDSNCRNHNVRTDLHSYQGQTDFQEKSNDSLREEGVCRAACSDAMLYDHLGDDVYLKLMRQEYCCSDLVDDPPPGFEHYRMISLGQIDLNEELNQINEEEAVCNTPCSQHIELPGVLRTLSKSQLGESEPTEGNKVASKLDEVELEPLDECHFQSSGKKRAAEFSNEYHRSSKSRRTLIREYTCNELLSKLLFTATDSLERLNLSVPIVSFFSQFKDSIALGSSCLMEPIECPENVSIRKMLSTLKSSGNIEPASLSYSKDSCCSDHVVEIVSEGSVASGSSSLMEPIEYPENVSFSEMPPTLKSSGNIEPAGLSYPKDSCCSDHVVERVTEDSVSSGSSSLMEPIECALKSTENIEPSGLSKPKDSCCSYHVVEKVPEDSVASGSSSLMESREYPEHVSISEIPSSLKSSRDIEPASLSYPKDSCCTDHVVEKVPEQQFISNNQDAWNVLLQVSREEAYTSSEQKISTASVASEPDNLPGKSGVEVGETPNNVEEDSTEPDYHTALVLTFVNMATVPSEGYLNKVFGCFGQLNEAETKVFNKRNGCRVVYRKHADAEAAFNGVGKHGIFRDTLLSYRLKYIHSKPARAPTRTRKRKNDSAPYALGGIQSPITLVGQ